MEAIRIKGGHRFRLKHGPQSEVEERLDVETVGVSPRGHHGLKAKMHVKEGEEVKAGQVLFHDKKNPDVKFTAPSAGTVKEIEYGPRRVLISVKIVVDDGKGTVDFGKVDRAAIASLGQEKVVQKLIDAGLWERLMAFPSPGVAPVPGKKAEPDEHGNVPELKVLHAVYVSALATEPHQADPLISLEGNEDTFAAGLEAVKQLAPKTWLFFEKGKKVPAKASGVTGVQTRAIANKYPACETGVQVFYTERLQKNQVAAGLSVEDVLDIGHLFLTGGVRNERIISVAGNAAPAKKHFKVRPGISLADLAGANADDGLRYIAGGVFTGEKVEPTGFMAPRDRGLVVMKEDRERTPFHFQRPGLNQFSLLRMWLSGFMKDKVGDPTTSNNGEERACVQCGACIDMCPVDLMPNLVFKAALAEDIEKMEALGIHDCTDCGLCTFICPSKIELDQHLQTGKLLIVKEG